MVPGGRFLRQVDQPDRVEAIAASLASLASAIWRVARTSAPEPAAWDDVAAYYKRIFAK